jgi:hypothetical protein
MTVRVTFNSSLSAIHRRSLGLSDAQRRMDPENAMSGCASPSLYPPQSAFPINVHAHLDGGA